MGNADDSLGAFNTEDYPFIKGVITMRRGLANVFSKGCKLCVHLPRT